MSRSWIPYYGIFSSTAALEMYQLVGGHYQRMAPNERGHYPTLEVELGEGLGRAYAVNQTQPNVRWWQR